MNNNGGFDPIVLHALGAVPDIARQRQTEEALQSMIMSDKMKQAASDAAQPGQTPEIPLLTEAIKTGAMDSELDDLEEAITSRRNTLNKVIVCSECGDEGSEDPWDCASCIDDGVRTCKYPEAPSDAERKQMAKARWQWQKDDTERQLAELRKELGVE